MDYRNGTLDAGVFQVKEVLAKLLWRKHSLVDEGAAREGDYVIRLLVDDIALANTNLRLLADHVELALKFVGLKTVTAYENLTDTRLVAQGNLTNAAAVYWHVAHGNDLQTLALYEVLERLDAFLRAILVLREEDEARRISSRIRKVGYERLEEVVRHLNQDARAVTTLVVGSLRTAVGHVDVDLKSAADYVVGLFALDVGDKAHATCVVLVGWVV